jgi:hypothetical protein
MKDRKINKVLGSKVSTNDLMAFVNYVKVKSVMAGGEELIVTDLDHNKRDIKIAGKDLIENSLSADQFTTTEKVTKTEAAEILISLFNRPFTVSFLKADKSERVLRGRFVRHEALLGRSMVEDLDEPADSPKGRIRQVDHREINFIICEGVKYVVK